MYVCNHSIFTSYLELTTLRCNSSPGPGVWFEKDFYLVTRGEGVTVKRNFECP